MTQPCEQHPHAPTFDGLCGGCTQYPADMVRPSSPATEATEPTWRAEDHAGHGSPCEHRPDGSCSGPATSALREQLAAAIQSIPFLELRQEEGEFVRVTAYVPDLIDAVLRVILPATRVTATLFRDSEATVQRVIDLHDRWKQAGGPPIGISMSRYFQWWDAHLAELHDAILPPTDQPKTSCTSPMHVGYATTGECVHGPAADQTKEQ